MGHHGIYIYIYILGLFLSSLFKAMVRTAPPAGIYWATGTIRSIIATTCENVKQIRVPHDRHDHARRPKGRRPPQGPQRQPGRRERYPGRVASHVNVY